MNTVVAAILVFYSNAGGYGSSLTVTRFDSLQECQLAAKIVAAKIVEETQYSIKLFGTERPKPQCYELKN